MKKIVAVLLTLTLVFGTVMTGCSGSGDTAGTSGKTADTKEVTADGKDSADTGDAYQVDTGEAKYPVASELERHKIGVLWYGWTDLLSTSIKKNMDYIGKEFNCEIVYAEAMSAEEAIAETENLIAAGCEGIISLFVYANMIEKCEETGVFLAQFCNETTDSELLTMIKDSKYFAGMVNENDEACGEAMVDDLYERGCRNIVWLAPAAGMSTNHDNRVRGIETATARYKDLNVLSNYRGDEMSDALTTFAVTYPDLDGIILTGGASGGTEEFYQVMTSEGLSDRGVIFATIDIGEGTDERLASGDLGWIAGGQFPTSGVAFTLVYNAITGNKVLSDPTKALYRKFMVLQSVDDYNAYKTYVEGDIPPYSGDELKSLIVKFNPEANVELYNQFDDNYGIDDVVARHKELFK